MKTGTLSLKNGDFRFTTQTFVVSVMSGIFYFISIFIKTLNACWETHFTVKPSHKINAATFADTMNTSHRTQR